MAKEQASSPATSTAPNVAMPAGMVGLGGGGIEVAGWVKPEAGVVVSGKLVGWIPRKGKGKNAKMVPNILIEMDRAVKAFQRGKKEVKITAGQVVGMPLNGDTKRLILYIESGAKCFLACKGKVTLPDGNEMWKYDVGIEGGKEAAAKAPPQSGGRMKIDGIDNFSWEDDEDDDDVHSDAGEPF